MFFQSIILLWYRKFQIFIKFFQKTREKSKIGFEKKTEFIDLLLTFIDFLLNLNLFIDFEKRKNFAEAPLAIPREDIKPECIMLRGAANISLVNY